MSRLAKRPIALPPKTEVTISGGELSIKGPKGTLTRRVHRMIAVENTPEGITVTPKGETRESRQMLGTTAAHIRNMITGVTQGYTKKLAIEGVGYKWDVQGKTLNMALGFSHPVKMAIPEGIAVKADKAVLEISGFDKEAVGQFAANVRAQKKPEPYKGKGIRYETEVIRRKQGKKAV